LGLQIGGRRRQVGEDIFGLALVVLLFLLERVGVLGAVTGVGACWSTWTTRCGRGSSGAWPEAASASSVWSSRPCGRRWAGHSERRGRRRRREERKRVAVAAGGGGRCCWGHGRGQRLSVSDTKPREEFRHQTDQAHPNIGRVEYLGISQGSQAPRAHG
jgi:hypothetical protein